MKNGFRRHDQTQQKFERDKRKNMDKYFQQVLNQKKQKYYEELQAMQGEGKSSTVQQMVKRV